MIDSRGIRRRLNILLGILDLPRISNKRVFVVTTEARSKGEQDFISVLDENGHKVYTTTRMRRADGDRALAKVLDHLTPRIQPNDLIAIVRGGGDINDRQFAPFKSKVAAKVMDELRGKCRVTIVTGIGHSSDKFLVEKHADHAMITPTAAGARVVELLSS